MNQPEPRHSLVQLPDHRVIQVGDRLYQVSEIQPVQPPVIQPPTPQPFPVYPSPAPVKTSAWDNPTFLILFGIVGVVGSGLVAVVLVRAFAPAPGPAAPSTVIVQPPQPEKRPYSYRECQPGGMFGWGQNCREERGWQ